MYDAVNSRDFYNNAEGGTGGDGWRATHRWMKSHPEEAKKLYAASGERLKQWAKDNPEAAKRNTKIMIDASKQWRESHPEQVAAQMVKVNEAKKGGKKNTQKNTKSK